MKTKQSFRITKFAALFATLLMAVQTVSIGTPTAHAASASIQSAVMQVTIDDQFPRVIQYNWLSNGKVLYGQEDALNTVKINGVSYTPTVQFTQNAPDMATYTLTFSSINVVMTVVLDVVDNVLELKVTNILESGSTLVQTVEIPNHSLISIRDTQAGAQETGVDVRSWNSEKEEYNLLANKALDAAPVGKSYVLLNTNDLAAAIYSNAFEIVPDPQRNDPNYNNYEQHYNYQTVQKTGYKKLGVSSYPWTYREISGSTQDIVELPYVKVAINADANSDGIVNWQDAGIGYRKIMTLPVGSDIINKVVPHIAHNRMITQWPFLRVLDNLKKFYLYSDGFGQLFEYKGQMEGNNIEPDYGRNFDPRSGGQTDLNTLATEALKLNAYVGIHINHKELSRNADSYSPERSQGTLDWKGISPIENMKRYYDAIDDGPFGLAARVAEIRKNVPDLKWTYLDVYSGSGYVQWKLAHELNKNGLMIGTEFSGALDRYSIWNHVSENESKVERFLRNTVADEFMYDPILLASRHAGSMSYGDDLDEDQGDSNLSVQAQMNIFFTNNLPFKYMQNYEIMGMKIDPKLSQTTSVTFSGGLSGQVVTPGTVTNDGTYVTNSPIVELKKNGNLIATYQKQFKKKIVDSSLSGYHNKNITPMMTKYLLPWDPQIETKLYHWNSAGGNTTWTLPASWSGVTTVDLYKLTDTGKVLVANLPVTSSQITINAIANTPYVVYKGAQTDAITPVSQLNFGYGGLVKDPGFDSRVLNNWNVTSTGSSTSHASIQRDSKTGGAYLQVLGNNGDDATIAQTLTGLTPGKTYQASVYAEVKNGRTLTIGVKDYGGAEVTNTLTKSNVKNKEFNTPRGWTGSSYMQRVWVNFTVPAGSTSATFYMIANAFPGSTTAEVDLDDVRVVELTNLAPQGSHVLFEDFESNQEGYAEFVHVDGTNQINRLNAGYTYNTMNGNHTLKLTASDTFAGELIRTIPTSLKLLPNTTYTVSFPYKSQYANTYSFALTSGYGSSAVNQFNDTLDNGKYFYSKTFTTGSTDDYSLRFNKLQVPVGTSSDNNDELLIDDFTVDLGTVSYDETADQTFDDGQLGGWIAAYGNGQVKVLNQQLSLNTDQYSTIALDQNTPDITDGEMTFTMTPQAGNLAGAVIRYTDPYSYIKFYYDPAEGGWFYTDMQGHKGTLNDPPPGLNNGIHLTQGIPHLVKLTYTGNHYKLQVDQVLLYDGDIPALKQTGGRTGFVVGKGTSVSIDNVTLRNLGAPSGSTPITPTPPDEMPVPVEIPQSQMSATATSQETVSENDPASNVLDGNPKTMWHIRWRHVDPLPQSITLNLGGTYKVTQLNYLPRQDGQNNGYITSYNIYKSTDNVNFTKIASGTWNADSKLKKAEFAPVSASYIKLEAVAGVNDYASAAEINVFQVEDIPVRSIAVSGENGKSLINQINGSLQMLAAVKPNFASDKTVTWAVYDDNGATTGAATIDATGLLTAHKDGVVTVVAKANDSSGVKGETKVTIDTTPPVTSAVISPAAPNGANDWYVHPVSLSLITADNVSGAASTEYSLDGGAAWQNYSSPVTLSQDGKYTVSFRSTDKAGNIETPKTISFNLDATAPTINVTGVVQGSYSDNESILPVIVLSDDLSGVDNIKTSVTLDTYGVQQGKSIPLYTLSLGSHELIVKATDLAGNTGSHTVYFQTTTSVNSMKALVTLFTNDGLIDNAGIAQSLQSKLTANNLADFVREVNAQTGKHISSQAANYLLRDAQYLLSQN